MGEPVFLITGASSGLGLATARRAAEAGYRLALAARRLEPVESLAEELGEPASGPGETVHRFAVTAPGS